MINEPSLTAPLATLEQRSRTHFVQDVLTRFNNDDGGHCLPTRGGHRRLVSAPVRYRGWPPKYDGNGLTCDHPLCRMMKAILGIVGDCFARHFVVKRSCFFAIAAFVAGRSRVSW